MQSSSAFISQMTTWETKELEISFLSTCVDYLETERGSVDEIAPFIAEVDQEWFTANSRKAVFHVIKKIVLGAAKKSFVVPGSIGAMAEQLLLSMGYEQDVTQLDEVIGSPSMFFTIDGVEQAISLWRVKLARSKLKANADQISSLLENRPEPKIFEETIPALIETQQQIWHDAINLDKRDSDWDSTISEVLSPLPPDSALKTGIQTLDETIQGGIAKRYSPYSGRLLVVAARPSMGKTAFAVCLATRIAKYHGDVAFFSLEMSAKRVQYRSIACYDYLELKDQSNLVNPIRSTTIRDRSYTADQRERLESYMNLASLKRLHIFDESSSLVKISSKIKVLSKTRKNLCAVFIDYLQLIEGCSGDANNTESSNIGNVTRSLKQLATSLGIDIVLISQLNRGVENRTEKMPNLSDLRASGRIEEDADIVMFLLRPYYYDKNQNEYELAIGVAKNREGECGTLECRIDLQSSIVLDPYR